MNQVIIIHGAPEKEEYLGEGGWPSPSNTHWIPWVQTQLSYKEILSQAPEMPRPYDLIYENWVEVFEQFKVSNETTLVGHSCGGGFLLRYLSENKNVSPKKVILVAPWLDPEPKELSTNFFDFEIDQTLVKRTNLHIFMSSDDFEGCLKSFETIERLLPNATYHKFIDKGHFTEPVLGIKAFPELLDEILK
jgi:predicted alpha/beta hydrolase family esterase